MYLVNGEAFYKQHCANCHGEKGEGLRNLYPALKGNSNVNNLPALVCFVRNGIATDQGSSKQAMPANSALFDLDLAQLATYIQKEFGTNHQKEEKVTVDQIKEADSACK